MARLRDGSRAAGYTDDVICLALARTVVLGVLGAMSALGLAATASCSDVDSRSAGLNAPCTRDHDCHSHLSCLRGVCERTGDVSDASDADLHDGDANDADSGADAD